MIDFWETVLQPILQLLAPTTIIEVGSELGRTTRNLAAFCRDRGAVLHAVDPKPLFDVAAWEGEFAPALIVHRTPSLETLSTLPAADVVLLDGDHNWFTVFHELKLLAERAAQSGRSFPVTFLHDVGWPYGRRDLYYAPERIPAEFRHPYEKKGLTLDDAGLLPTGGVNRFSCNACQEGGPRNGVLTAVEDFLATRTADLRLIVVPGFHGLGVIFPTELGNRQPAAAAALAGLDLPPPARAHVERLERDRLATWVERTQAAQEAHRRRHAPPTTA